MKGRCRKNRGFCGWYFTAFTDGYVFSTRTKSESIRWEDGFYFEVFPPIVHYCRELWPLEVGVSRKEKRLLAWVQEEP